MNCFDRPRAYLVLAICIAGLTSAANAAEPVRLTSDGTSKRDPVFVPGSSDQLIFGTFETEIQISLMRLDLSNKTITRFHPQANTSEFELSFSPDGRYYAFVQSRGNLNLKLIIRDTKESKEYMLDPGPGFAGMCHPTIAPDLSRVVCSMPSKGGQQLVAVDLNATKRRDVTIWQGVTDYPKFSPDGKRIAFASSRDGDFEIYTMQADGSDLKRLTNSPGRDVRPAYSFDGGRIAFASVRDGNFEIYVMHADGSHLQRVTNNPERDDYPCWSPDGKRLVYVAEREGKSDLYEIEVPNP